MLNQGMMLNGASGAKRLYEYWVIEYVSLAGESTTTWYIAPTLGDPTWKGPSTFFQTNISIPPTEIKAQLHLSDKTFALVSTSTDERIKKDLWFFCAETNSQILLKLDPHPFSVKIMWRNENAPTPFPLTHGEIIHCYIGTVPYK